jgi:hypothetical protein
MFSVLNQTGNFLHITVLESLFQALAPVRQVNLHSPIYPTILQLFCMTAIATYPICNDWGLHVLICIRFLIAIFKEGAGNGVWCVLLHYLAGKKGICSLIMVSECVLYVIVNLWSNKMGPVIIFAFTA